MNANTTSFATSTRHSTPRTDRPVSGTARSARAHAGLEENCPQVLPLVLAVLPLRPVVQRGRASPRHA
ncbi:MAG: hypothetical protein ABIS43_19510 [Opitutus sp.]